MSTPLMGQEEARNLIVEMFFQGGKLLLGEEVVTDDGEQGQLLDILVPHGIPTVVTSLRRKGLHAVASIALWNEAKVVFQVGPERTERVRPIICIRKDSEATKEAQA